MVFLILVRMSMSVLFVIGDSGAFCALRTCTRLFFASFCVCVASSWPCAKRVDTMGFLPGGPIKVLSGYIQCIAIKARFETGYLGVINYRLKAGYGFERRVLPFRDVQYQNSMRTAFQSPTSKRKSKSSHV